MILLLLTFYVSFILVAFMIPKILMLSLRKRLIDPIDLRKIHSVPASRLGGVTFFPAILLSVWLSISLSDLLGQFLGPSIPLSNNMILESLALLLLFLIGIYDDLLGVSYRIKFLVQITAALLIIGSETYFKTMNGVFGVYDIPSYVGMPLTLGFYVFVTNSINLIDGIDGLASLLSIMALFVYAILLYVNGMMGDSLIAVAALGALIPFCYNNILGVKRRAYSKIFMGDTGSLVLGAILSFLAVTIWNITYTQSQLPINKLYAIMAYTMLIIPCFDVIRVMLYRVRKHRAIFLPDKSHIHHRFISAGATPRQALLSIIKINVFFVSMNLLLSLFLNFTYILIIDIVVWTAIHINLKCNIKVT